MTTIFVDLNASGSNNGSSWNNAHTNLQTAISNAQAGDEIWVARGIYRPTRTDRTISFTLKDNVKIYGGFEGSETALEQRNIQANVTELSGDIGTPNVNTDNTHHVVRIESVSDKSLLDGFSITNGNAEESNNSENQGGGIYSQDSAAILANLTIRDNRARLGGGFYSNKSEHELNNVVVENNFASRDGGGVYNDRSNSVFAGVTFNGNVASRHGGAIHNQASEPEINNASFDGNIARSGGAIYNQASKGSLVDSSLLNNGAFDRGGAIYNFSSAPQIDRTIFQNNLASNVGGGIYSFQNLVFEDEGAQIANSLFVGNISSIGGAIHHNRSSILITNSTFTENTGRVGAAISVDDNFNTPSLLNSIVWNNQSLTEARAIAEGEDNIINVSNSIIEGGFQGENVSSQSPRFRDAANLDFRLSAGSFGINQGNEEAIRGDRDLDRQPRIAGNGVDLGAYEGAGNKIDLPDLERSATLYVDFDATGNNNGTSWANAYNNLQTAIAAAPFGSQIWVAEGTYKPQGDRNDSFNLANGVAIYGGFAGDETEVSQRNIAGNQTILSGDLGVVGDSSDNSYQVVNASNTGSRSILDGLTVADGNADDNSVSNGGGIYGDRSQAIFANLILEQNTARNFGGGIYLNDSFNQFFNVSFLNNLSRNHGGGIYSNDSTSILNNAVFKNNQADTGGAVFSTGTSFDRGNLIIDGALLENNLATANSGGAIYHSGVIGNSFNINNAVFRDNSATERGGGLYVVNTDDNPELTALKNSSTITNSIFTGNESKLGGAIYNSASTTSASNLTIANNQAENGAAIYSAGNDDDNPVYSNSIIWENNNTGASSDEIVNDGANTVIRNSVVEGGYNGLNISDRDPQFADANSGDFRLQENSPAINAGLNDLVFQEEDLIGNQRIIDNRVDAGAYEYFAEQDLAGDPGTIGDRNILVASVDSQERLMLNNVHRFYQNQGGFHFYSSNENEVQVVRELSEAGELPYSYESEQFTVLGQDTDTVTGETISGVEPVYRFYNNSTGAHLYTMDEGEKNFIQENLGNYNFEGIQYYAFETEPENLETVPVYRMLNQVTGTHLFTVDQNEVNFISENLSSFSFEGDSGVAFHVFALES